VSINDIIAAGWSQKQADCRSFEALGSRSRGRAVGRHTRDDGSVIDVELSSYAITFGGMPAAFWSACDVTRLRSLLADVIAQQEQERRRDARELDEGTAQTLIAVLLGLRNIEEAAQNLPEALDAVGILCTSVAAVLESIQRTTSDLRPSVLDRVGLEAALELLAVDGSRKGGPLVDVRVTGAPGLRLPESTPGRSLS